MSVSNYAPAHLVGEVDAVRVLIAQAGIGELMKLVETTTAALPMAALVPHADPAISALAALLTTVDLDYRDYDLEQARDAAQAAVTGHLRGLNRAAQPLDYQRHAAAYWLGLALCAAARFYLEHHPDSERAAVYALVTYSASTAAATARWQATAAALDALDAAVAAAGEGR